MSNTNYNYQLTVDEDNVLTQMVSFFEDMGCPDNMNEDDFKSLSNKIFNNLGSQNA